MELKSQLIQFLQKMLRKACVPPTDINLVRVIAFGHDMDKQMSIRDVNDIKPRHVFDVVLDMDVDILQSFSSLGRR